MPLMIRPEGPLCCPVILCDHCGREIDDARQGNYQWTMSPLAPGRPVALYFTHKACCRDFEQARPLPEGLWGWTPLECLPVYLANNLKVDRKKARHTATFLARL